MEKIITLEHARAIAKQLRTQGKRIVLVGGCFDILHEGHLIFLQLAKAQGDVLFVAVENDEKVQKLKGSPRPVNSQEKRTKILAGLDLVDYIIILPTFQTDEEYLRFTQMLSPHVIAITQGDPKTAEKDKQAQLVGGKVVAVTKRIEQYSTTNALDQK